MLISSQVMAKHLITTEMTERTTSWPGARLEVYVAQ